MPVNISESAKRMAMQSAAESEKECIEQARNLVAKASVLAVSTERKTQLLDLLEVFRDFTEKGRVNKHSLSVLD
jgi:phosphoribosylformylglycinamidine (FGAM) synthase-like enzyme